MLPSHALNRNKAKRRRNRFYVQIEMSALLAVMVVLLFIVMFAHPGPHQYVPSVDMAQTVHAASAPGARREDAIRIAVTKDGTVYFRTIRVIPEALPEAILDAVHGGAEPRIYLAADARAKYADVARAVEQIKRSGITNITFLSENVIPQDASARPANAP
jgi:biopolymer transport protein ExbD